MPLKSITFAVPRTAKVDTNDTPAELPSGRVRFSDELGRETALVARREQQAASRASAGSAKQATADAATRAKSDAASDPKTVTQDVSKDATKDVPLEVVVDPPLDPALDVVDVPADSFVDPAVDPSADPHADPASDRPADPSADQEQLVANGDVVATPAPPPGTSGGPSKPASIAAPAKAKAARASKSADRTPAASAEPAAEEIALALAQLGLALPVRPQQTPAPSAPLDPLLGTRALTQGLPAETANVGGIAAKVDDAATAALVMARADGGAPANARALLAEFEKGIARDAAPSTAKTAADDSKAAFDLAQLLGTAASTHAAGLAAHAARAEAPAVNAATAADPAATHVADVPRVALAELPRALPALLDELGPQMRLGKRGRNWEVEMRLDPPELGSLHIKFELHGDSIRGVVHCEPRVEHLLGPVLKELEDHMKQQGGGASFDLSRQTREGEERSSAPRALRPEQVPVAAAEPRASFRRSDPSRLVDVTA